MQNQNVARQRLRVLIAVKTYPIPSKKYDELVCTAGVLVDGSFVRLYPINFRDLPFDQQYKKYQWIEVDVTRHKSPEVRKESYRPDCDSLTTGEFIPTGRGGDWSARAEYILKKPAASMEALYDQQSQDKTSLGIFRPKRIKDLIIVPDDREWKPEFLAELQQQRLWETRLKTSQPPRKLPFKFKYQFECDDARCTGNHEMMIEDWEVGALFWRLRDKGKSEEAAAAEVRSKFFNDLCGPDKDTYFIVGTVAGHGTWVIIGLFYPKKQEPMLF